MLRLVTVAANRRGNHSRSKSGRGEQLIQREQAGFRHRQRWQTITGLGRWGVPSNWIDWKCAAVPVWAVTGGVQTGQNGNMLIGTGSGRPVSATPGFLLLPTTTDAPTGTVGASGQGAVIIRY